MNQELVKYEEIVKHEKSYNLIQKWNGENCIEEKREYYQIFVMNDDKKYRINPDDFDKFEKMLNNPSLKFIKLEGDLIAIHQITKVEKISETTFSRPY